MIFNDIYIISYLYRCGIYEACAYENFDSTVKSDGNTLGTVHYSTVDQCKDHCNKKLSCKSFGYCPREKSGTCYLRDKKLSGSEETIKRDDGCYTVFLQCQDGS